MSRPTDPDEPAATPPAPAPWAAAYAVVPVVAMALSTVLALADPTRVGLGPVRFVGVLPVAAGVWLVGWTTVAYVRAGETLSPVTRPDRLVTSGPLSRTRNPLYLGVVATVAGVAVLSGSAAVGAYAAVLATVYHGLVVLVEEPKLERTFGETYVAYRERVPRWLPVRRERPG